MAICLSISCYNADDMNVWYIGTVTAYAVLVYNYV